MSVTSMTTVLTSYMALLSILQSFQIEHFINHLEAPPLVSPKGVFCPSSDPAQGAVEQMDSSTYVHPTQTLHYTVQRTNCLTSSCLWTFFWS